MRDLQHNEMLKITACLKSLETQCVLHSFDNPQHAMKTWLSVILNLPIMFVYGCGHLFQKESDFKQDVKIIIMHIKKKHLQHIEVFTQGCKLFFLQTARRKEKNSPLFTKLLASS